MSLEKERRENLHNDRIEFIAPLRLRGRLIELIRKQKVLQDRRVESARYGEFFTNEITLDTTDEEYEKALQKAKSDKEAHDKKVAKEQEKARKENEKIKKQLAAERAEADRLKREQEEKEQLEAERKAQEAKEIKQKALISFLKKNGVKSKKELDSGDFIFQNNTLYKKIATYRK